MASRASETGQCFPPWTIAGRIDVPSRMPWSRGHPPGELLSSHVDGEVDPAARQALDTHLAECTECRDRVASFGTLRLALQTAPKRRTPTSLNRDVWSRISAHEDRAQRNPWTAFGGSLAGLASNAIAIAAIAVLAALIAPGATALWTQLVEPSGGSDVPQTAAQPPVMTVPASLPTATEAPTATAMPLVSTPVPLEVAPSPPVIVSVPPTVVPAAPGEIRPAMPATRPAATFAPSPEPGRTPAPMIVVATTAPVRATATAGSPALLTVSGTVSFVDRKARTIAVSMGTAEGERSWTIRLSDGTQFSRADGRRTTFEDVGIADQVQVGGFEPAGQAGSLMAASLRITVSGVASASQARAPRILFVVDGAELIRAGQYGQTGDWARRLASTGFEVTTADPARVTWSASTLRGFDLVAIGSPATLNDAAISAIKLSRLPVLDGEPRLVQPLGLGVNVDPANPTRQAPAGKTIDVVASGSLVTKGLSTGETIISRDMVYRIPIISNGVVLGTVSDAGQRRAVWAQTGTAIYLGAWNSGAGANHTDAYWAMFDRSVIALLGRDPSTSAVSSQPTATRAAR